MLVYDDFIDLPLSQCKYTLIFVKSPCFYEYFLIFL